MTLDQLLEQLRTFAEEHAIDEKRARDIYAVRQILARLRRTEHRDRFRLKGGLFVSALLGEMVRTSRDADLLEPEPRGASQAQMRDVFAAATRVPFHDHLLFENIRTGRAQTHQHGYDGVAVSVRYRLGRLPGWASFDINFSDKPVPPGAPVTVPLMFAGGVEYDMPAYSPEAFLAEKVECAVSSFPAKIQQRVKDFYDVRIVAQRVPRERLSGRELQESFRAVFTARGTSTDSTVFQEILSMFADERDRFDREWEGFKRRAGAKEKHLTLEEAATFMQGFAAPILDAISEGRELDVDWDRQKGWLRR